MLELLLVALVFDSVYLEAFELDLVVKISHDERIAFKEQLVECFYFLLYSAPLEIENGLVPFGGLSGLPVDLLHVLQLDVGQGSVLVLEVKSPFHLVKTCIDGSAFCYQLI